MSCRTPRGVRGLKYPLVRRGEGGHMSHPSRGAWIEISYSNHGTSQPLRRTPRGVRGLKSLGYPQIHTRCPSHPSRGAWIEIITRAEAVIYE